MNFIEIQRPKDPPLHKLASFSLYIRHPTYLPFYPSDHSFAIWQ